MQEMFLEEADAKGTHVANILTIERLEGLAPNPFNYRRQFGYLVWLAICGLTVYYHIYTYETECVYRLWYKS